MRKLFIMLLCAASVGLSVGVNAVISINALGIDLDSYSDQSNAVDILTNLNKSVKVFRAIESLTLDRDMSVFLAYRH